MRRVKRGSISSELLMCGGGVRSILLLPLVARCIDMYSSSSLDIISEDVASTWPRQF